MSEIEPFHTNTNLEVPTWLHGFLVSFSIKNIVLAIFTIWFQHTHPNPSRNMGRFFLIILGLQSIDKLNFLVQELFMVDLSLPYFEI